MAWAPRHGPALRRDVGDLMRGSDLTPQEIAARTGVPYSTVCRWNLVQNWRPAVLRAREAHRPQKWSEARVAALARVARVPGVDPGDLAEALGARRDRAEFLFRACGLSETVAPQTALGRAQREGGLRAALRVHVARQIGELDALLTARGRQDVLIRLERAGRLDTAKMLRNLVGLKKLLDEIEPPSEASSEDGDAPGGAPLDLVAIRADIARRYEMFAAQAEAEDAAQERAHGRVEKGDPWGEGIAGPEPAAPGAVGEAVRGAGDDAGDGAGRGGGQGGAFEAAFEEPFAPAREAPGPRIRVP